jgi:signal transduction histidine kinase
MSIVSHDLRSPLGTIQLCTELLATDDPSLAKPVELIKASVAVMTRLTSDLRDVDCIETGHLSINLRSEDAIALVREAVESMRDAATHAALHIELWLPDEALVIDCDRVRIMQVLTNILSNAIKFTPRGGSITVTLAGVAPALAEFSVADTGNGIPAEDLPHIFDRYWQARDTAHLGTGLGLAIAKGIVEAHAGAISVDSRVGQGTTFSFTLPRVLPSATYRST